MKLNCTTCRYCGPKLGRGVIRCDHPSMVEGPADLREIGVSFAQVCADFEHPEPAETPASETPASGLRNAVLEPAMAWFFRAGFSYGLAVAGELLGQARGFYRPGPGYEPVTRPARREELVAEIEGLEAAGGLMEDEVQYWVDRCLHAEQMAQWALDPDTQRQGLVREWLVRLYAASGLRRGEGLTLTAKARKWVEGLKYTREQLREAFRKQEAERQARVAAEPEVRTWAAEGAPVSRWGDFGRIQQNGSGGKWENREIGK